ncbi:uncharacterized protein A1O9_12330 [Exophiala aquamarina CBS 119918]|uniref:3-dehydrosphinganine reductase n=1 Tax=Exophiala aquamarina CBS 119918 TaxID=1182545 RepID=A0A072P7W3_9EURO|nr:uncharacterized protein A1O9_12330 [Exophiala aquamarina CBS 119918]KEF51695.1 hypothetical protein A1O9_12330 [Exophiala aquamarina CBS 119918]
MQFFRLLTLRNPYILYTISFVVIVISRYLFLMLWKSRKNHFPVAGLTAIVTGGSQGLGFSLARALSAKGANVVIVAQDIEKLDNAQQEIQAAAARPAEQKFLNLSFDLRSPDSAPEILKQVTSWNQGRAPDLVFCCAGSCHPAFLADASIDTLRGQMDTIYWSSAYMAHAVLNLWKEPSLSSNDGSKTSGKPFPPRHIVFTCSTLAFVPVAGYSPYSPAKAAMRAMVDGLNQEVAVYNGSRQGKGPAPDADINVHIVFPMGIVTPGLENENRLKPQLTVKLEEDDKPQTPDDVAKITLKRLEAGDYMVTTTFLGHLMKGAGMGGSARGGFLDIFWNWLGSIVVIFAVPDLIWKCKAWGKQRGLKSTVPASTN